VPTVLLLVSVFILAIAWRSDTATPAFSELNLPTPIEQTDGPRLPTAENRESSLDETSQSPR
jgi:hypothetical protein